MEIHSSLINSKEFEGVKNSLVEISEIDGKEKFRVDMLEYINDSSDDNDDEFFYDMLEFVRFLNPSSDHVAYTTPEHLIFMNAPAGGKIGENVRQWEFVYDHECLHQLWDTFGVEDRIKAEGIEFNHMVLNIASDCVINDYLSYYRKKTMPDGLITPQYLKEEYNIDYDRKKDTQYTLYLKLLEVAKELEKDKRANDELNNDQQGQGSGGSGGSNSGEGSSKGNGQGSEGEGSSGSGGSNSGKGSDKGGQNSGSGKESNKKEGSSGSDGSNSGEGKDGKEGKGQGSGEKGSGNQKSTKGQGSGTADRQESDADLERIRKEAEDVINKYKDKISGDLGKFIDKCKASQKLNDSGLVVGAKKGVSAWNKKLQQYTSAYVKNKVFKKQREFKRTYQKVKRGSGFVEYGQPIQRGKKLKDDKLLINVAFYVDRSGSMSGCIDDVFKASYVIANSLQKQFGKEKVVDKVSFKMFAFDTVMKEVEWGKKVNAGGGTMDFDEILKFINDNTNDYMINVIITDAEFVINEAKITKFLSTVDGCVIFVTNVPNKEVKEIANKNENKTKLFYIEADSDFTVN